VHFGGATTSVDIELREGGHTVRVTDATRTITCGIGEEVGVVFDTERALLTREV
jgi:hypothetical protein